MSLAVEQGGQVVSRRPVNPLQLDHGQLSLTNGRIISVAAAKTTFLAKIGSDGADTVGQNAR